MTATKAAQLLAKRKQLSTLPINLFDPNFPQQEAFIKDPNKLKALFCTRRAAKSFTAGLYMVYEAITNPGCNCLFIGLTRSSAKDIVWKDILQIINRKYGLKAKFNLAELTMTFPNRSIIRITGVDTDENEMNKLLGKKYRLVCIDEASLYTVNVRHLVYDILKPAMTDLAGTICMMGTSSNFTRGLFFDITNKREQGWSLHSWSAHDNPYVSKRWQEELDEIDRDRPLYKETPQFKQWYLNRWVVEDDKLVYKFNELKNIYKAIPTALHKDGWTYILGVDTGWEDDNAFVLCGYHANDPHLYVIKTFNKPHMTFDQVVTKVNEFMADKLYPPSKVIIDGANKQGVESMRVRSSIPFEYADKQGKVDFIEMLNADLIQSKILISPLCTTLIDELMSLVWKTNGDVIVVPKKEHPSLPNHLCDALLYAWRNGYHFHSTAALEVIPVGSKAWYAKQADDIWEKEREKMINQQENNGNWPEGGGWGNL